MTSIVPWRVVSPCSSLGEDWHDMTDRVLNGKVALVTGAAGEIGTATIQLLAERGARIVRSRPR